jgi:hypothetical protein
VSTADKIGKIPEMRTKSLEIRKIPPYVLKFENYPLPKINTILANVAYQTPFALIQFGVSMKVFRGRLRNHQRLWNLDIQVRVSIDEMV